jgi:elongation factor P
MAMLDYSEITKGKFIVMDGAPYEVLDAHVFRKQQRKPVNAVKLKNLITGKVSEPSFHVSDKAEEAEIDKKEVKYLYTNKGEFWFCEVDDPSKRFTVTDEIMEGKGKYLKPNTLIDLLMFGNDEDSTSNKRGAQIIGVRFPAKVELKVTEAMPAVKGNTVQGGTKIVVVETGATVNVPMFIKEGEIIKINTETGEYAERVGGNNF